MICRPILVLVPLAMLAACGGDDVEKGGDSRTAAGEVLEGSISDGMIPLDAIKSQAPLMKVEKSQDGAVADETEQPANVAEPATDAADPVAAAVEASSGQ